MLLLQLPSYLSVGLPEGDGFGRSRLLQSGLTFSDFLSRNAAVAAQLLYMVRLSCRVSNNLRHVYLFYSLLGLCWLLKKNLKLQTLRKLEALREQDDRDC